MAPKPTGKPGAGKKPSNQSKKGDAKDVGPKAGAPAGDGDAQFAPPKSKDEVMAQISFEGLPTCPTDQIVEQFSKKYVDICKIFAHYCKYGECKTMDAATRLRMAGFKQLIKDARMELKVYNMEQLARLFNLKGGAKGIGLEAAVVCGCRGRPAVVVCIDW